MSTDDVTEGGAGRVVVVGAGLAGVRTAEELRRAGFDGEIVLVGAEPHLPYDRPPLSKQLLSGEWPPDRILLRAPGDTAELDVTFRLGTAAGGLDLDARRVLLADGGSMAFDGLIIATGSEPRRLPGQPDDPQVVMLRTLDDALALRAATATGAAPAGMGRPRRSILFFSSNTRRSAIFLPTRGTRARRAVSPAAIAIRSSSGAPEESIPKATAGPTPLTVSSSSNSAFWSGVAKP